MESKRLLFFFSLVILVIFTDTTQFSDAYFSPPLILILNRTRCLFFCNCRCFLSRNIFSRLFISKRTYPFFLPPKRAIREWILHILNRHQQYDSFLHLTFWQVSNWHLGEDMKGNSFMIFLENIFTRDHSFLWKYTFLFRWVWLFFCKKTQFIFVSCNFFRSGNLSSFQMFPLTKYFSSLTFCVKVTSELSLNMESQTGPRSLIDNFRSLRTDRLKSFILKYSDSLQYENQRVVNTQGSSHCQTNRDNDIIFYHNMHPMGVHFV